MGVVLDDGASGSWKGQDAATQPEISFLEYRRAIF
jgi:hypothetical protein